MSMQQSTELIIFVTHVEAEDSYLKIWGQIDKNSATCIERMILPLVDQFALGQGCPGLQCADLRVNALCCARFQNEGYYRARIINIRADGMIVLQFIDYGNIEVLSPQEIHLLENIPGSESLQSFPPVAFDFTLMNVLPINDIWENKIIESIKKTLWYNEYKIVIHSVVNSHRFIKLWYNNEDFSELLVKKHMAVGATMQEMFRPKCIPSPQVPMYQQSSKHLLSNSCTSVAPVQNTFLNPLQCEGNNMHRFRQNITSCCGAQQKHITQPSVPEALVFKSRVLDVGSKHDIYVSFVEDGPHKFSVQVQSTSQILSTLMREINTHPLEPLQEPPLPGSVCLGRYTQDKVLCRAVVMSVMENKCKLYYVDFGHTEVLSYTDIFQLPPHYIKPKVLSIRFTLSGVQELNVTDEMKKYFKKIVSGKSLVLHVRPPEGPPLVQYGDLYDNGKNVKDILRQAFSLPSTLSEVLSPVIYKDPAKLSKDTDEVVHVSFVDSCKKFFVQLDSDSKSLESIMNCLATFCKTAPTLNLTHIKVGLPCAALYDDQWYRAQILNINADNVTVLYVDYGNEEIVDAKSLRIIHDDLVKKLQAQAIKCILNGWQLLPSDENISNQFESLILEKHLYMKVIDIQSEGIVVDLYDLENKENIKSKLLCTSKNSSNVKTNYQNTEDQFTARANNLTTSPSENMNKWQKKNQIDSWGSSHNDTIPQERSKSKAWKNEFNDEKQHEKRNERNNFYRGDTRNERFNKDDFPTNKNVKERWHNKYDQNEASSFRGERSIRGNRSRTMGTSSKHNHSGSSDKSWSDKDSDTSSRGSNRRGKGNANYGSYSKRDGAPHKVQNNRWSDKDKDKGLYSTGDSYYGNSKPKERKGQSYRITQNKMYSTNSSNVGAVKRHFSPQEPNELEIPPLSVSLGTIKTCEIVFMNNPCDFFIQLSPDYNELDNVMERIAAIYENGGEVMNNSEISTGVYCIAQYTEDSKWYRAVIKSVEGNNADVQFVDYGNTESVEFAKIKVIQKEFLKLPMQAIHCKLFGVEDFNSDQTNVFGDKTSGKSLEVEFITEDNKIYSVLLKESSQESSTNTYINEEFSQNINLLKAKEEALNNQKTSDNLKNVIQPDYAPFDAKWTTTSYTLGSKHDVIVTWFINPNNFYCQALDKESEFRAMMNEIQRVYVGKKPASHTLEVGSTVIATFADDGALYRAEIVELYKVNGHVVQYIDFGNTAVVDPQKIYPVEKKFMELPKQVVQCSLMNIIPKDENGWSKINTEAIDNCFNADKYECTFHECSNNKYLISLRNNDENIADTLVEKKLALFATSVPDVKANENAAKSIIPCDVQRVDINLLSGQILRIKVSHVINTCKFYIQLPSAKQSQDMINAYMSDKNPEVMQRLSACEMCLGTGCLVYSNGLWKRAVINKHSQSTGFGVKLIDTGVHNEIFSDSVLALPGELSVMQNQALECSLESVPSSLETDVKLKERIEGEEVLIYICEVDDNRLIVKLFDLLGKKINIIEDIEEEICPVCPMPILTSTHKVSVSYADHSASIWLQRNSDYELSSNLSQALEQYYSTSGKMVQPKIGQLCAAKSNDGYWCRAKVLQCTEMGAYVNYIDYGNNEEVLSDALMILDPQFYLPHQLTINVSLTVMLSGTNDEQLNTLQSHLKDKELTAVFYNVNKEWTVELLHEGEKISDKFNSLNLTVQKPASGQSQIHDMAIGCKYNVYVSHVDTPSQFWLQYADEATDLSKKQEELQEQATKFPVIEGIPEEGSLCVAVYSIDNLWYRAQVLDADEDITTVRFIDYGNTDVIDNSLKNIRKMPDSWNTLKAYAIKCRLDVIPVDSEDWNATVCDKFENLTNTEEPIQTLIIADSIPKRVDLFVNDKSITEMFVEEHYGIMVHTEEDLIDEIVDIELDPHSAFVSHINSPNEFWVQEEKSVGDLEVMTDRFIVADMFPKVDEIKEGLLCVAKFPEDEQWYRARVISCNENNINVIYIDYGNSAVSNEIRAIPADLADISPLSRRCCLDMPEGITEWSDRACAEFIKLAADGATIFLLDVLKEDETSLVKLTLNDTSVANILAEFCERYSPVIEERLPPLGEENLPNVFITRVITPNEFWVQTKSSTADLDEMLNRMQAASTFLPLNTLEIGTICAAIYPDDDQWYRAKILSSSESGIEVLYIDYGNCATTSEVRMLPADIMNIPPLSKRCALQNPDAVDSWSPEACKMFEALAADPDTMFQYEVLDTKDPSYVKLYLNGKNVSDMLRSHYKDISHYEEMAGGVESQEQKEEVRSQEEREEVHSPEEKEEVRSQEEREEVYSPEEKEEVRSEEEREEVHSPEVKEEVRSQEEREEVHSPEQKEEVRSQEEKEEVHSAEQKEEVRSQEEKEEVHSPEEKEEVRSQEEREEVHSPEEKEEVRSQEEREEVRSPEEREEVHSPEQKEEVRSQEEREVHSQGQKEEVRTLKEREEVRSPEQKEELRSQEEREKAHGPEQKEEVRSLEGTEEVHSPEQKEEVRSQEEKGDLEEEKEAKCEVVKDFALLSDKNETSNTDQEDTISGIEHDISTNIDGISQNKGANDLKVNEVEKNIASDVKNTDYDCKDNVLKSDESVNLVSHVNKVIEDTDKSLNTSIQLNIEIKNQCSSDDNVVELSVDEIIQNMSRNTAEDVEKDEDEIIKTNIDCSTSDVIEVDERANVGEFDKGESTKDISVNQEDTQAKVYEVTGTSETSKIDIETEINQSEFTNTDSGEIINTVEKTTTDTLHDVSNNETVVNINDKENVILINDEVSLNTSQEEKEKDGSNLETQKISHTTE